MPASRPRPKPKPIKQYRRKPGHMVTEDMLGEWKPSTMGNKRGSSLREASMSRQRTHKRGPGNRKRSR